MDEKPRIIYSNMVGVSQSPFEIRLEFGIETPNDGEEPQVEALADIRLSPQTAKALRDIMNQAIMYYEENVGVIPILVESGEIHE